MGRVTGKVAIVTGAARGQGAAEARLLVAEGAQVMLTDILDNEGQQLATELGPQASYQHHDVSNEDEWLSVVKQTETHFGPVQILVNNAGILGVNALTKTTVEEYMRIIEVNQLGVFLGMKHVADSMKKAGGGSIINISSIDGLIGMSYSYAYVASKFAVRGMTKCAAIELGPHNIRVNSVHPGGIDTPMIEDLGELLTNNHPAGADQPSSTGLNVGNNSSEEGGIGSNVPLGRIGTPEEAARLILFLASDESSYSSGSEFIIDGGMTAGFSLGG